MCGRRGAGDPLPHSPGHTPLVALAPLSRAKGAERCCTPFSWRRKGQRGVARLFHREGGRNGTPLSHGERGANERSDVSGVCPRGREGVWGVGVGRGASDPPSPPRAYPARCTRAPFAERKGQRGVARLSHGGERGREVLRAFFIAKGAGTHAPFAWRKGRERAERCERGMPVGG